MLNSKEVSDSYEISEELVEKALTNLRNGNSKLYVISGKIGSGKDTIAEIFMDREEKPFHEFFARPLKIEVQEVFDIIRSSNNVDEAVSQMMEQMNIDEEKAVQECKYLYDEVRSNLELTAYIKTVNVRKALQYWGTEVRREQDDNYWVKRALVNVFEKLAEGCSVFVTDARFPNEMDAVVNCGGSPIRLDVSDEEQDRRVFGRDNVEMTQEARYHHSETALDDYQGFHARVMTDGLTPNEIVVQIDKQLSE